ncbi:hypothetical protein ACQJBY_005417 [Aegilops geniculata]
MVLHIPQLLIGGYLLPLLQVHRSHLLLLAAATSLHSGNPPPHPPPPPLPRQIELMAGGENTNFVQIAGGDQVKLARLREIRSWFDNTRQMSWTAMATLKNLTKKKRAKLCPPPAQPIHKIEILLWAMEQANSSSEWTRRRWWAFRSRVEHPLDQEPTVHEVPLQIVQPPTESPETPKRKMRRTVVATSLPRRSPRFPRRSPRLNGGGSYV